MAPNTTSFVPAVKIISAITNSNPALVTTTQPHLYTDGLLVRLFIPPACLMRQADGLTGEIICTGANTFTININTTTFDVFTVPVTPDHNINTIALAIPIGENTNTTAGASHNSLTR